MSAPTSYTELAEMLDRLPFLVADARRARGLSGLGLWTVPDHLTGDLK